MRSLFALAALVVIAATPSLAYPCRMACQGPSPASAAKQSKVAFVGTITKTIVTSDCHPKHPDWCTHSYSYEVAVEGVWKGSLGKTITVDAGSNTGDCSQGKLGKNIDGQKWLFFSRQNPVKITMCSGTRRATDAHVAAITRALGAPSTP